MAKKNKKKIPPALIIKSIAVVFIFLSISTLLYAMIAFFLNNTPYFKIKSVIIEPDLSEIYVKELMKLKGKPIFSINLDQLEKKLRQNASQITDLKLMKEYPDQIRIKGRIRHPFAKIYINNKLFVVDDQAVVLYLPKEIEALPEILGIKIKEVKINIGDTFSDRVLLVALDILKRIKLLPFLLKYDLSKINIDNPSGIELYLINKEDRQITPIVDQIKEDKSKKQNKTKLFDKKKFEEVKIILDQNNLEEKIKTLNMLILQNNIDLNQIKYIDLRFKDPVIAQKEDKENKGKK